VTNMLPSLSIRSSLFVRTGDQSMSSWLGGGSSVINLGFGGIGLLVDAAAAGVEGPKVVLLRVSHLIGECTYR
jgi:hypothetical protein